MVGTKVAVTVSSVVADGVQLPVPLQPPPLHPVKVDPVSAVAINANGKVLLKVPEQVVPQDMFGVVPKPVTAPLPEPAR